MTYKNATLGTFGDMVGVGVKTWGASASIVVDPISLTLNYGGNSIGVRETLHWHWVLI